MPRIFILLISLLVLNCDHSEQKLRDKIASLNVDKSKFPFYQSFDTLEYLKTLNIKEEVNLLSLSDSLSLDTFTLTSVIVMGSYPSWKEAKKVSEKDSIFSAYYISPFSKKLELPKCLSSYSTVTFIGYISKDKTKFGPKIIYFYYKIHKPYFVNIYNIFKGFELDFETNRIDSAFGLRFIEVK